MFDLFGSVKGLLKLESVCIDNSVFRLHYKVTVIILVAFSILVTSKQYIGDPIDCIVDQIPQEVMDTYCWIYSTFTIPNRLVGRIGKDVAQPGVAPHIDGEDEIHYHKYYQWVCFFLFFQAILFYVPRYLWKSFEGGRVKMLVLDLHSPVVDNKSRGERLQYLEDYFKKYQKKHNRYAMQFFLCEFLNLLNVILQIFFVDYFLGGEFLTYGSDVWRFTELDHEEREDPMARVFPKVTKCTFHKYGPSGGVQKFDGLCILPLNILNEKIFVIMWFWFVILSIISGIYFLWRLITMFTPKLKVYILVKQSAISEQSDISTIVRKLSFGDWFIISQLGTNMDPLIFQELIKRLSVMETKA